MQDHRVGYSVHNVNGGGGGNAPGGGGYPVVSYLLQQTLRRLCTDSDWVYAVFWRILPRNYPPPKWDSETSLLDRSKGNKRNWILVWEDGFCDFAACARYSASCADNAASASPSSADLHVYQSSSPTSPAAAHPHMHPELFFKMSHDVYNYGEGLMGKVAADNSHRWIYKEPMEADSQYPPSWQGALDPHPRTWEAQFKSGIETIAIVAVKEGLLQLGSLRKAMEDLNFVLFLQRKFNYLQSIPGVYAVHPVQLLQAPLRRNADPEDPPRHQAYVGPPASFYADVEQAAAGTSLQTLLSRLPSVPPQLAHEAAALRYSPATPAAARASSNSTSPCAVSPRSYAPGTSFVGYPPSPSSSPPAASHPHYHALAATAQYSTIDPFAAPFFAHHHLPPPALFSPSTYTTPTLQLPLAQPTFPDPDHPSP